MLIFVVEDDDRISDFLIRGLEQKNYSTILCKSAEEALEKFTSVTPDLYIVDITLPKLDGIQLVEILRYKKVTTPILMLSALNGVDDKVRALDAGADDYMTKAFHFDELIARIKALTRRMTHNSEDNIDSILDFDRLKIDTQQYQISLDNEKVDLSPKEFKLLIYLVQNKNKAVSRIQLLQAVWGINFDNQTNVVDVYISYLRSKIEKEDLKFIHTVKGIGYIFRY